MLSVKKVFCVLLFIEAMASVGCVSMSTLQTARTLEPDQTQQSFGGGIYNSKTEAGGVSLEMNLPYMEYSYRQGLMKDLDAGLKVTIIGAYQADVKYQLLSQENLAVAVGGGLAYMEYKVTSGSKETNVKYIDAILPLYLSYDFNKSFSLYTSPKYLLRTATGDTSGTESLYGLGLGTKIGEKSGVYLEAAIIKGKGNNAITQYNASYFW